MSHKLLLADDSVTIQRVVELTFSGEDVKVLAVGDGEEAIARIPAERPDIVMADIAMPKRSGYEVAAFVKGHPDLKHIPVLLLAGAFEPVDEARAEEAGCDGVLVKPFEPHEVIARVRELLGAAKPELRPPAPRPLEFPRRDEARGAQEAAPADEPARHDDFVPERSSELDEAPPAPEWGAAAGESLEDYFDRLDAAFSSVETTPPPQIRDESLDDRLDVPTLDDLIGPPAESPPPAIDPEAQAPSGNVIAEAFTALLAVEEGEPGARPVRLTSARQEPVVTEALIEEVTRRVLERLAPGAVRDAVADIVSEVAERLVREEIARVRNRS